MSNRNTPPTGYRLATPEERKGPYPSGPVMWWDFINGKWNSGEWIVSCDSIGWPKKEYSFAVPITSADEQQNNAKGGPKMTEKRNNVLTTEQTIAVAKWVADNKSSKQSFGDLAFHAGVELGFPITETNLNRIWNIQNGPRKRVVNNPLAGLDLSKIMEAAKLLTEIVVAVQQIKNGGKQSGTFGQKELF